jgi:membrane-associated phospholipid phosphatase
MLWWHHITALGGLNVTALIALAIGVWLGAARCWRLALAWCLLFGAAMLLTVASQVAFLGWGIGVQRVDFAGFSGHAARAAAVFPVAFFLLLEGEGRRIRAAGTAFGVLVALAVAVSRVKIGAHSPSEAVLGCTLGLAVAALFMARARVARRFVPSPLLVALSLAVLLLPKAEPADAHQWVTGFSLGLSGHDRPYTRPGWKLARAPYVPPCPQQKLRLGYMCT